MEVRASCDVEEDADVSIEVTRSRDVQAVSVANQRGVAGRPTYDGSTERAGRTNRSPAGRNARSKSTRNLPE